MITTNEPKDASFYILNLPNIHLDWHEDHEGLHLGLFVSISNFGAVFSTDSSMNR